MTSPAHTVRLRDLLRSVVASVPDTHVVNQGLFKIATLKPDSKASLGLVLQQQARKHGKRPALRFEDQVWTYTELNAWVNRLAALLRSRGVGKGDSVGILIENRPEALACVAAAAKLGAVAGMLNHNQRGEVLHHSIDLVKAKLLIVGNECLETLQSTGLGPQSGGGIEYWWDGEGSAPAGFHALRAETRKMSDAEPPGVAQITARTPVFYIFTSGTTGMPKASIMSNYRWLKGGAGLGQLSMRLRPEDIFYCCLPLYHNNALTVSWGSALTAGSCLALSRKFSASRFWDDIRRYEATAFCYIGELCRYLLNQPANPRDRDHRVRVITGNGLRAEIWDEFQSRFGIERICEFYGASEANVAFVNGFGLNRTAGFCPLPYSIVAFDALEEKPVRGKDGFMRKVGKGEVGLLITEVSDKNPFDGYTDPKASEAKLFRNVFTKGDCWFNSGDLVRDQGLRHIQFVDRVGDTFRWKGENVATTEVEGALNKHGQVEQAVVYGVQLPGADGRAGMASLTWKGGSFDGAALAEHVLRELPAYAVPLFIRLREDQEVTGTFKFRKVELKQQAFDPSQVSDPLYVLADRQKGYQLLDRALFLSIQQGKLRF